MRQLRELAAKDPGSVFRMIIGRTAAEFSREELTALYAPMAKQPWYDEIDAAERNNEPGVFTAFAGWEWSSNPGNKNLHRVVFSPSPAAALRSFFPFSNLDSERPEDSGPGSSGPPQRRARSSWRSRTTRTCRRA